MSTSNWIRLENSKNQVKKAARSILDRNDNHEQDYRVIANFRSAHAYPMESMIAHFREKALTVDTHAVIVRRLKRIPSIINKLKREPKMSINTMDDIGGVRIIVKDMEQVSQIRDAIATDETENRLIKTRDYLKQPKPSGYRGIHISCSYQGSQEEYKNFRVELQIRSYIQHVWATAVEMVGGFTRENLKAGIGDKEWLEFFRLTSLVFADLECRMLNQKSMSQTEHRQLLYEIDKLKKDEKLQLFAPDKNYIIDRYPVDIDKSTEKYFLLQLDHALNQISITYYSQHSLNIAADIYRELETKSKDSNAKDIVLVSAKSIDKLKNAYPNYFTGMEMFLDKLNNARFAQSSPNSVLLETGLSEHKRTILQACALFDKFDVEKEARFIATNIARTDIEKLHKCIKEFKEQGIVNQAGRFVQLTPDEHTIRLATDWWRTTSLKKQQELVITEMPGQLDQSFFNRLSKLNLLPEVQKLTESLYAPQGIFDQSGAILSDRGSFLFRSFVEVNPKVTSDALFRILSSFTLNQLKNISDNIRGNLVWALEKLCFHKEVFDKSAECLMRLAVTENENWGSSASGQFQQLFRVFLSGTTAIPEQRLTFLRKALKSADIHTKKLLVKTLGSSIGTTRTIRVSGAEHQGSGEPLEEYVPRIWQEVFDYWKELLSMLTELVLHDQDVGGEAKDAVGNNISGLMYYAKYLMTALDDTIRKIVASQGPLWISALNSIKDSIRYNKKKREQAVSDKLYEWVNLLSPTKIKDRIQLIVSNSKYEGEKREGGRYIDLAEMNAQKLATELSVDINAIVNVMRLLIEGNQSQGYTFGQQLAKDIKDSADKKLLIDEAISTIKEIEKPNITFLLGMLKGTHEPDIDLWLEYETLFKNNVDLVKYYAEILKTGEITEEQLDIYLSLIDKQLIPIENASAFWYGGVLKHLSPEIITRFIEKYYTLSANAAWIALDILTMYCYGNKDKGKECKETFKRVLPSLCLRRENMQNSMNNYHWKGKIEDILEDGDAEFAKKIMQQIIISVADNTNLEISNDSVESVTRKLFSKYGAEVWPIVAKAIRDTEPHERYRLSLFLKASSYTGGTSLSILADLNEQILKDWYASEPEIAPEFAASIIDFYTNSDESYELSSQAKFLLDNYGEHEEVLNALSRNAGSSSYSGSLVLMYEKESKAIDALLDYNIPSVKNWAQSRIAYLESRIGEEKQRDEEGN